MLKTRCCRNNGKCLHVGCILPVKESQYVDKEEYCDTQTEALVGVEHVQVVVLWMKTISTVCGGEGE